MFIRKEKRNNHPLCVIGVKAAVLSFLLATFGFFLERLTGSDVGGSLMITGIFALFFSGLIFKLGKLAMILGPIDRQDTVDFDESNDLPDSKPWD